MAQAISAPRPIIRESSTDPGLRSSPRINTRTSLSSSVDRERASRTRSKSPRVASTPQRRVRSETDENAPPIAMTTQIDGGAAVSSPRKGKMNGSPLDDDQIRDKGNGGGRTWRDGSLELESDSSTGMTIRQRKNPPRSARPSGANSIVANGLATLPTIPDPEDEQDIDHGDSALSERELSPSSPTKPPPPAPSTQTGTGDRPVMTRKRRSSSVKRKLSPGVTPTKAVDWEIPRKTLHSSIGFITLFLKYLDPPTLRPLLTVLITALVTISFVDFFRLRVPAFAELWEQYLGFLMRESERQKVNGVVWYLVGVIFVLGLYPRDVAVVAILTLSWSDTTASTIGRLWGKKTAPLPSHVPGIKLLPFAPRKSLAGFLAATVTGFLICTGFWWNGSDGRWTVLDGHGHWGLWVTASVVGLGGAVVEALDLGLDDNLTLPILSGALVWLWLGITNLVL